MEPSLVRQHRVYSDRKGRGQVGLYMYELPTAISKSTQKYRFSLIIQENRDSYIWQWFTEPPPDNELGHEQIWIPSDQVLVLRSTVKMTRFGDGLVMGSAGHVYYAGLVKTPEKLF